MKAILLIGRILFSLIFLPTPMMHFSKQGIDYAASKGVPIPEILVPVSSVIAVLGALSIILGFKARIGAWLIVIFLVPVAFFMHRYWNEADPMARSMQMSMFMKNISMTGGALIIAYFGAGPMSLDAALNKTA